MSYASNAAPAVTALAVMATSATPATSAKTALITFAFAARAVQTVRRSVLNAPKSAVRARMASCARNVARVLTVPARTASA